MYLTGESFKRTILNVNITVARSDQSVMVRGEEMSGEWMRCTDIRHLLIILSVQIRRSIEPIVSDSEA